MTQYTVKAVTREGLSRTLTRHGDNERDVALSLLNEQLIPISVVAHNGGIMDYLNRPLSLGGSTKTRDLALFCEQLSAMGASGLTVEQALKVIARQAAARPTTKLAQRLLPRIQRGMALSEALDDETGLPRYLPAMIRAAESGGRLAQGLDNASRYLQRQAAMRTGLVNALTYPAIVLGTVIIALVIVLVVVVPSFEPVFAGEEAKLPATTRFVLWLSAVALDHGGTTLMALLGVFVIAYALSALSPAVRDMTDRLAGRITPVRLVRLLDVSRVLGVMGMLFDSGVEASESVALAAQSSNSRSLRTSLDVAARRLREGASISTALRQVRVIPEDTSALIEVGEHTGSLGATTGRASQLLESDTANQIERLVALANPVAIVFLGVVVGLVVGGVMLGILSINQLALSS